MRKLILAMAIVLGLTLVVGAPASAAPRLGVDLGRVTTTEVVVRAVCPVDPPSTLFVSSDQGLIASQPVECTRRHQRFVIPVTASLTEGQVLTGVQVTVSGDSGEVSAFYDEVIVR